MTGPFTPHCMGLDVETGEPTEYLQLQPERHPGGAWLHQPREVDRTLDCEAVIDRYALPPSEEYVVSRVTVSPGTHLRIGDTAPRNDFGPGGGTQHTIPASRVPDSEFSESWFERSDRLTELLND